MTFQKTWTDYFYERYSKLPDSLIDGLMKFLSGYPEEYTFDDRRRAYFSDFFRFPITTELTLLDLESMYFNYIFSGQYQGELGLTVSDVKQFKEAGISITFYDQGEYLDDYTDEYPGQPAIQLSGYPSSYASSYF